jgi:hypothetical protein
MPISAQTFTPEEIDLTRWLADPVAKRILQGFVTNPPAACWDERYTTWNSGTEAVIRYYGPEVEQLLDIRDRYETAVIRHCKAIGDTALRERFRETDDIQAAIRAVLIAAPLVWSSKVHVAAAAGQARAA